MDELFEYSTVEQRLFQNAGLQRVPLSGSLELLPLCNLECKMCYVRLTSSELETKGRLLQVDEWLKLATELREEGVLFLLLTGGEPFIYPEFRRLYLALRHMGFILTINTNGTLITSELADFLGKYPPRRVNVTLYGASSDTYSRLCGSAAGFEKTMQGIELLLQHGVQVKMNVSAVKENLCDIEEIRRIADSFNIPVTIDTYMQMSTRERVKQYDSSVRLTPEEAASVSFNSLRYSMNPTDFHQYVYQKIEDIDKDAQDTDTVRDRKRYMNCMAGKCSFTVNWQGYLRPCAVLSVPSLPVLELGFHEAWKQLSEITKEIELNQRCAACKFRSICRTCAAAALYETGDFGGVPAYKCQYAKALYQHFLAEIEGDMQNR